MSQIIYPAIIESGEEPGFAVFFPDLPGCVSAGDTLEEAFSEAMEALALHLAGMAEDGAPLPDPTPLAEVRAEPGIRVAAIVPVPAEAPGRTVRTNITIDANLLAQIDALATNRSAFLADAARRELARRRAG
ncbi:MAG: type II toxin-antitoxin system HicB family antitoxin [Magnetospirillum sp. WYHS-4]